MVGPAFSCFTNPLGAVRFLFQKACADGSLAPADFCKHDWGVQELFRKCVLDSGSLLQVPEINSVPLDTIPANSLVRFRGMVQDMFNAEFYVGAVEDGGTWCTNKYRDMAAVPMGPESKMQIWDRRPLYCVPVPGENAWVKDAFATPRGHEATRESTPSVLRPSDKRHREEMDIDSPMENSCAENKRVRGVGTSTSTNRDVVLEDVLDMNASHGEKTLFPCLVKVYDGADAELKLNDVVEFVGVLTFDPGLSVVEESSRGDMDGVSPALMEEDISAFMPASKVPRLHCILYRKLHGHSLLSVIPNLEAEQVSPTSTGASRSSLLQALAKVLGGDILAAEYLLLHLLSQVYARVEPMAVGKLSLNLTGCDAGVESSSSSLTIALTQAIELLLPRSHLMPISLDILNKAVIGPKKNYESNRLVTGPLQLAEGTHLTLDETALKTGYLSAVGVHNLHLLKDLIEWQKVEYDFEFYKMEMQTDVPVLILSSARSRLFPADVTVPINCHTDWSPLFANQLELYKWRMYISASKALKHSIDPSMQKVVEEDLVAARQGDRSLGPEIFHRWLTMARLLSISFGETTLSLERWHMVRDLERRCAERLRRC